MTLKTAWQHCTMGMMQSGLASAAGQNLATCHHHHDTRTPESHPPRPPLIDKDHAASHDAPGMEGADTKRQRACPSCPWVCILGMKPCAAEAAS